MEKLKNGWNTFWKWVTAPITYPVNWISKTMDAPLDKLTVFLNYTIISALVAGSKGIDKLWYPFYCCKSGVEKKTKLKTWIRYWIFIVLLLIAVMHFISIITFFGMSFTWRNEDQYGYTLAIFTSLHFFFAMLYYFSTRIPSLWYNLYVTDMVENRRDIMEMEFAIFGSGLGYYILYTVLYTANFGIQPYLFPTSMAYFISTYGSFSLGMSSAITFLFVLLDFAGFYVSHPVYLYVESAAKD
jgi:hypothetical protein